MNKPIYLGFSILDLSKIMNSENSRISEYHVLVLKLTDELDIRRGQKSAALSNLSIYYTWKNIKI